MKTIWIIFGLIAAAFAAFLPTNITVNTGTAQYKFAESCVQEKCKLPNCRCSKVYLNEDIPVKKIPQLVTVTFDDAVTALNYEYVRNSINLLRNPDGCKAQATFFVAHEYTDYTKVHELWADGHEIALHSITHTPSTKYWKEASVETLVKEFGGQREMLAHFANMDINDIKGIRVPLFELSGNNTFIAMDKIGLTWDSSWPTQHFVSPGVWPYSLEYLSDQDCPIGRCPTASIPNVWVVPIHSWDDDMGHKCAMIDACIYSPEDNVTDLLDWMISNFNQHYLNNRAPFGIYLHAAWFLRGEHYFEAFSRFLKHLNSLQDVYIVSTSRVLEYARNPRPDKPFTSCQKTYPRRCRERFCQLRKIEANQERWMKTCVSCPAVYPWLGNPLGKPMKKN